MAASDNMRREYSHARWSTEVASRARQRYSLLLGILRVRLVCSCLDPFHQLGIDRQRRRDTGLVDTSEEIGGCDSDCRRNLIPRSDLDCGSRYAVRNTVRAARRWSRSQISTWSRSTRNLNSFANMLIGHAIANGVDVHKAISGTNARFSTAACERPVRASSAGAAWPGARHARSERQAAPWWCRGFADRRPQPSTSAR